MSSWPMQAIRHLGQVTLGKMLQTEPRNPADVELPYLRAAHIQPNGTIIDASPKTMWFSARDRIVLDLQVGDVVVVEGGAGYGRSAYIHESMPGWGFQNSIVRIRPHLHTSSGRFLDYALQSALSEGRIQLECNTATFSHFTAEKVSAFRVPTPSLSMQRSIADYLDDETSKIDALIEKQRALVLGLQLRRTALVASMMDRRVAQGRRLKWYIDEIDVRAGQRAEGLPLLSVSIDWGVRRRDEVTTDLALAENLENYKVACKGDLVINRMRAFQGALGVAPVDGLVSPDYAVLKCKIGARPDWLALLMRSPGFVSQMVSRIRGIGTIDSGAVRTPRINVSDLGEILVDVPPITQQLESVQRLGQESSRMGALIAKSERLIELSQERRAALIMAAVNGRIDVAEMDCEQEAA